MKGSLAKPKQKASPKKKTKRKVSTSDEQKRFIQMVSGACMFPVEHEHRFHPKRLWRFDIAVPSEKIAFEYEGVFAGRSRHTSKVGYSKDTEKYNAAALLGWRVFRYTANTYMNVLIDMKELGLLK